MADIPIQIINGTNGIIIQTDDALVSSITLIATIVLAASAIIALVISKRQTDRSHDLVLQETKNTSRPWVGSTYDELETKGYLNFNFNYTNYGRLPAHYIKRSISIEFEKPSKDSVKSHNVEPEPVTFLAPGATKSYSINFDYETYTPHKSKGKNLFICILIRYEYAGNKTGEYGVIFEHISKTGRNIVIEEWSD